MECLHQDALTTKNLRDSLDKLLNLTPEQLKHVAEFVKQAGGFENARAAIIAIEELSDAA
jgi:hypothetical protein